MYPDQGNAVMQALHYGQRQGLKAGVVIGIGAFVAGKVVRKLAFERFGVKRKVEYDFSEIHI